ncbi:dephospho-CoA kinase [Dongia mobilis]|uniref:Dephospho-CoA kinase n=1 Tax=Dongia mobilis TaxID=578943 RepID=A0A4R6WS01_9PROT|nr:dephospho-CoA kinase [Dongia mobilis]TDQ82347.1 dephospho-CoA kinase [Dongia mobilis]
MHILGLTGSIGMGKSTAAAMLRRLGVPVHDADAAVHRLMGRGGQAVARVAAAFPGTAVGGAIDRGELGARVFGRPAEMKRLEAILHPLVRAEETAFLRRCRAARRNLVVLDIPLLFETGGEKRCDRVVVVTAPQFLQKQRVLKRPGMTPERLAQVLGRQMPDREKRLLADWVVETGLGRRPTLVALQKVVRSMRRTA